MDEGILTTPPSVVAPLSSAAASGARDDVLGASRADTALQLRGVSLAFGGVAAVTDIDLVVASGEIRAVIGPNGAGKSSLINIISGIYRPDMGSIAVGGQSFSAVPTQRLARLGIARTFQNLALFPGLDVTDNVAIGLTHRLRPGALAQILGLPSARQAIHEERAAAVEMIAFLGLSEVARRPVATLAYGLQKRVELARALVARPRLLLLDEPMAGMTAGEKAEMARFIREARDRFGTTVILIEHDIGVVMTLSDRIAVLDHGVKIADGLPAEVRADQAVIDAYLGVDHSQGGAGGH